MFNRALADVILERLLDGMSLRRAVAGEVAPSTVLRWASGLDEDAVASGFVEQYARVRALGYQLLGEEIVEIADGFDRVRKVKALNGDGEIVDTVIIEDANDRRLRLDARKWMLAKMLPKVYGDKLDLSHSGEVGVRRIVREIVKPPEAE